MPTVLTLIAAPGTLAATAITAIRDALVQLGGAVGPADWLAPDEAADLSIENLDPQQVTAAARHALGDAAIDLIAQPAEGRRKRLLLADMDSTIVCGETLDELAAFAGLKDRIAAITRRAMNGELDFHQALIERVGLLRGLPATALQRTWDATSIMPGAATLVATMRANGAYCALVSGGFSFFTERVADRLGFDLHRANTLLLEDGALTGGVAEPILDRHVKLATLKELAAQQGLPLTASLAVGDGANDLDMILAAGLGVAYHAKPIVAAAARARIDHADLAALLFAQGYRRTEFHDTPAA